MGKQTGVGVRAGKVKHQTPKVSPDPNSKKKPKGRANLRKKVAHQGETANKISSPNSNADVKKFGSFSTDSRPSSSDPNADLWHPKLHTTRKTSCDVPRPERWDRSHHQEGGKANKKNYKLEREIKSEDQSSTNEISSEFESLQSDETDPNSCCSSTSQSTSDQPEADQSSEQSSSPELTDFAFIQISDSSSTFEGLKYDNSSFGFHFEPNFLDPTTIPALLSHIDSHPWTPDTEQKRVQIFGYNYLNPLLPPQEIPEYLHPLLLQLRNSGFGDYDQLIISEFLPGIGVKPHVDRFFWEESIIGISLLSSCTLHLRGIINSDTYSVVLTPGSLYRLQGKSRYEYSHEIDGATVTERRISLTFRNLAKQKVIVSQETVDSLLLEH